MSTKKQKRPRNKKELLTELGQELIKLKKDIKKQINFKEDSVLEARFKITESLIEEILKITEKKPIPPIKKLKVPNAAPKKFLPKGGQVIFNYSSPVPLTLNTTTTTTSTTNKVKKEK